MEIKGVGIMKTITIELDDAHYDRYEYLANNLGKTVEGYAKQHIENIADTFYQTIKDANGD
jgi:predicted DNA-binding protein